jgi:hypothetical protein
LDDGFVKVVAPHFAGCPIAVGARYGEDPLPRPRASGLGVLAPEGVGDLDPTGAAADVVRVEGARNVELSAELIDEQARERCAPVLASLAVADR